MKRNFLTVFATLTLTSFASAQAPAEATTPAAATTTAPAAAEKKVKPLSQSDVKAVQVFAEALLFHIKMGDVARGRKEKDETLTAMGTKLGKETKDMWTPMVNIAQAHQMDGKNIPTEITKNDKANLEKLGKNKDEKYTVEYLELFTKEAKRNAKSTETAAKSITDPELKTWADGAVKVFASQAEELEAAHKEAKKKKK